MRELGDRPQNYYCRRCCQTVRHVRGTEKNKWNCMACGLEVTIRRMQDETERRTGP